jgi:hypothetical protein
MKRTLGLTTALVVALALTGYAAQKKADFSGTWTPDVPADTSSTTTTPPAGGGGGGGMRGGGGPMTVKQTADTLTVETQGRNGPQSRVYKLDGSETEMPMGQATAKVTAKWDGDKLVITTKTEQGEQTQTWSLADGKLKIDRTGGRGPSSTTYKKTT